MKGDKPMKSRDAETYEESDVESDEESDDQPTFEIKTYKRRFLVAGLMFISIGIRGFNQSLFGSANNVLSKFYKVHPWQIDWLTIIQAVMFIFATVPMSFLVTRIGFKKSVLMMILFLFFGFALDGISIWIPSGFPLAIVGQALEGLSSVTTLSIQVATAAIWFPANEVSNANAFLTISRGVGESCGAVTLSNLLRLSDSTNELRLKQTYVFGTISGTLAVVFILTLLFVQDKPDLPPSIAQAKAEVCQARERAKAESVKEGMRQFATTLKNLFTDRHFLILWAAIGIVNPLLRNYTILLSSVLHEQFPDEKNLNSTSGFVLMGSWLLIIVAGCVAGPIITKTKRYRAIAVITTISVSACTLIALIGILSDSLITVYTGVILLGFFVGVASVVKFELVVEVTYPLPTLQATMLSMIGVGIMRLCYPIVGRVLLEEAGTASSLAFPFAMTALAAVLIISQKLPFRRLEAETSETSKLLSSN